VTLEGAMRRCDEAPTAGRGDVRSGTSRLLEEVVERDNRKAALRRVRQHKGRPGIDGMTTEELLPYLREHGAQMRGALLTGTYRPQPVRRCERPKQDGGLRPLGIPTTLARFMQQAILPVLQPRFAPTFSAHSDGFRPGRSARQAIAKAQRYVEEGRRDVVEADLEPVFERVNHDVLLGRLAKRIEDKRVRRLIRHYLEAGVMCHGGAIERHEGTPQGGPLSPRLANVRRDEVDRELEKRGHAFVRDADDCNVSVRFPRAGERVMALRRKRSTRLHLKLNEEQSAVARVSTREFRGIAFWRAPGGVIRRCVADKAVETLQERVREITGRSRGRSMSPVVGELREDLLGWPAYCRMADTPAVSRRLDEWIRPRLRQIYLQPWQRSPTIYRELRARGASNALARSVAYGAQRWRPRASLRIPHVLTNAHFDQPGVPRPAPSPPLLEPPAVDPHGRWCGRDRKVTIPIRRTQTCHRSPSMDDALRVVVEMHESLWGRLKHALADLSAEECHWRPLPHANTIHVIVRHLRIEAQWHLDSLERGAPMPTITARHAESRRASFRRTPRIRPSRGPSSMAVTGSATPVVLSCSLAPPNTRCTGRLTAPVSFHVRPA
jgi:RNA-directed DNA polymerase